MFEKRQNEPSYALLNDKTSKETNRYGKPIEIVTEGDELFGSSLKINSDAGIGENPNRYKQHGFFFNADNCIACHACEAACSEKNDNPAHIAFRSVGFVEGGTYPDYQRLNISMACNHCDDPVCLKGCPTRAYTKFAEYGAVLQDPDICFGCGYCTWVCPYNAPQLDPVKGEVSKCNMCVDRLEVGLKPSCVAACLGNALDFGVIENIPPGRSQAKSELPGFPRTDITHPNIRFQQTRTTPRDMKRVDSTALKYHRSDNEGDFHPSVDPKHGFNRQWNLKKLLGSHENAHIAFTLSSQAVMGAFILLLAGLWGLVDPVTTFTASKGYLPVLVLLFVVMAYGLFKLNMHLGKPHRFYRGFYNLRWSPVSREIAGVSLFFTGLAGVVFFAFFSGEFASLMNGLFAIAGLAGAVIGGYFMYKLYRIPARPFWNHWYTGASFLSAGLTLGPAINALLALLFSAMTNSLATVLASTIAAGLLLEMLALAFHAHDIQENGDEGAVSFYEQITTYGYAYWLRNILLLISFLLATSIVFSFATDAVLFALLSITSLTAAILGRALFYVLVIPTTMPGAFFWRNKGFVEHARETGLAEMPQVGVVYEGHHAFDLSALLSTMRMTSFQQVIGQLKAIVSWK
jgi:DMSO reductase iron-sulfur subunit